MKISDQAKEWHKIIGERLRQLRKKFCGNSTVAEYAQKLGLDESIIWSHEQGKTIIAGNLAIIIKKLREIGIFINPSWLLGLEDNIYPKDEMIIGKDINQRILELEMGSEIIIQISRGLKNYILPGRLQQWKEKIIKGNLSLLHLITTSDPDHIQEIIQIINDLKKIKYPGPIIRISKIGKLAGDVEIITLSHISIIKIQQPSFLPDESYYLLHYGDDIKEKIFTIAQMSQDY